MQIIKAVTRKTVEFISATNVSVLSKSAGFDIILLCPVFQNLPKFNKSSIKETFERELAKIVSSYQIRIMCFQNQIFRLSIGKEFKKKNFHQLIHKIWRLFWPCDALTRCEFFGDKVWVFWFIKRIRGTFRTPLNIYDVVFAKIVNG